jgi:hypothetical protein
MQATLTASVLKLTGSDLTVFANPLLMNKFSSFMTISSMWSFINNFKNQGSIVKDFSFSSYSLEKVIKMG